MGGSWDYGMELAEGGAGVGDVTGAAPPRGECQWTWVTAGHDQKGCQAVRGPKGGRGHPPRGPAADSHPSGSHTRPPDPRPCIIARPVWPCRGRLSQPRLVCTRGLWCTETGVSGRGEGGGGGGGPGSPKPAPGGPGNGALGSGPLSPTVWIRIEDCTHKRCTDTSHG